MLKKILHYNDLSQEVISRVPKLKKGEVARFKCVLINPDINNERKYTGPRFYNTPSVDSIWDEGANDYVEIGFVDRQVLANGEVIANRKTIKFSAPSGEITLRGGVQEEEYLYYFLSLSNRNGSNENRDVSKSVDFVRIDEEKTAKEKNAKRSKKFDALLAANNLTNDQIKDFVAATGGDDKRAIDLLKDYVFDWADKNPDDFLVKINDVEASTKATIKRALDTKVIEFDKADMTFKWGESKEKIASVPKADGVEHINYLSDLLLSDKRYEKVLPTIKKSLKAPSKQAS
jgi:hypothetical protein